MRPQHDDTVSHLKQILNILNIDDCKDLYVWCKKLEDVHVKDAPMMVHTDRNMSARL
jgi:hypothetical protein